MLVYIPYYRLALSILCIACFSRPLSAHAHTQASHFQGELSILGCSSLKLWLPHWLPTTFSWSSYDQRVLWQLCISEMNARRNNSSEMLYILLTALGTSSGLQPEAASAMLSLCALSPPEPGAFRTLYELPQFLDHEVKCALVIWSRSSATQFPSIILDAIALMIKEEGELDAAGIPQKTLYAIKRMRSCYSLEGPWLVKEVQFAIDALFHGLCQRVGDTES